MPNIIYFAEVGVPKIKYCPLDVLGTEFIVESTDINYCLLDLSGMQFILQSTNIDYCPLDVSGMGYTA